jgi:hypothetical protein
MMTVTKRGIKSSVISVGNRLSSASDMNTYQLIAKKMYCIRLLLPSKRIQNNLNNTHLKVHCEHQLWLLSTQQELDQGWFEGRLIYLLGNLSYPAMPVQQPANKEYKLFSHTNSISRK